MEINSLGLDEKVSELVNGELRQLLGVGDDVKNLFLVGGVEVGRNVVLELGHEERGALGTAALVADGVLNRNLIKDGAVVELDEEGVANGALVGGVVFLAETGLLNTVDLCAEGINSGIGGGRVGATRERSGNDDAERDGGTD